MTGRRPGNDDRSAARVDGDAMERRRRGLVRIADADDETRRVRYVGVEGDVEVVAGCGGGDRRRGGWRGGGGRWRKGGLVRDRGLHQCVGLPILRVSSRA